MVRADKQDLIYKTADAKWDAVAEDLARALREGPAGPDRNRFGREVRAASRILQKRGIPHSVLNAKHHEKEGEIIAQAGRSTRSPSRRTWPVEASTSSSEATQRAWLAAR